MERKKNETTPKTDDSSKIDQDIKVKITKEKGNYSKVTVTRDGQNFEANIFAVDENLMEELAEA